VSDWDFLRDIWAEIPETGMPKGGWKIGPAATTNDPEAYKEYISHPKCAEAPACPWHVWWQNGHMDDSFPPALREYCFNCAFWHKLSQDDGVFNNGIIVAGEKWGELIHYGYDAAKPLKDPNSGIRGFGGRTFYVRFMDERGLLETNDLWPQGEVPTHLRHLFTVNAVFETKPVRLNLSEETG